MFSFTRILLFRPNPNLTFKNLFRTRSRKRKIKSEPKPVQAPEARESSYSLGKRLRLLLRPTVFTIGGCVAIELASPALCKRFFPEKNDLIDVFDSFFNKSRREGPLSSWWNSLTNVSKLSYGIAFVNCCVFASFRLLPSFVPTLAHLFVAGPTSSSTGICLAIFTHIGFFHLLFNNYVLVSFAPLCSGHLRPSKFLELYLESGLLANYFLIVSKILTSNMSYRAVGASAAIYGLLGYLTNAEPEVKVGFLFLSDIFPQLRFRLEQLPWFVLLFDGGGLIYSYLNPSRVLQIAHGAHIIGYLLGYMFYHLPDEDALSSSNSVEEDHD